MTDAPTYDGDLDDVRIDEVYGHRVARGLISNDRKGRFANGKFVNTSPIVEGPDADGVIKTKNSVYRIRSYAEPK